MSDTLWTRSEEASPADTPDGNAMEAAMRRSLEDNTYSLQGFWLWQARAIHQRRHREQGRRRPRGESAKPQEESGPRNEAEAVAEQHADDVKAYIAALLHATGYPYPEPLPDAGAEVEGPEGGGSTTTATGATASQQQAERQGDASALAGLPTSAEQQQSLKSAAAPLSEEAPPLKVARLEAKSAATPKSALAKLVAKAKAHHSEATAGGPTVTVLPAPGRPAFPEELPLGLRGAYGSSNMVGRKRVQFVEEPTPTAGPAPARKEGAEDDDDDDEEEFGVHLPGHPALDTAASHDGTHSGEPADRAAAGEGAEEGAERAEAKHPSQMTRAEFLSQFKRAPRRGEIGQSAEDIAAAEELGYVMSGSRSVASRMYVDRVQRQLHEHEATKLQQQFRKVEDERMDDQLVHGLAQFIMKRKEN